MSENYCDKCINGQNGLCEVPASFHYVNGVLTCMTFIPLSVGNEDGGQDK